jgi:glycosyltransferase involved in cell wall biosynthesis
MPRVSVIIPTYDRAQFVAQAVASVLAQSYRDFELIVVDDGSYDATVAVLESYAGRLHYVYQQHQERSTARNTGIALANGELLAFLDSDDLWLPSKLDQQVAALDAMPHVGVAHSGFTRIDTAGRAVPWPPGRRRLGASGWVYERMLTLRCAVLMSSTVLRRDLLGPGEGFRPELTTSEDVELMMRLAERTEFYYDPAPLVRYRLHAGQTMHHLRAAQLEQMHRRLMALQTARHPVSQRLRRRAWSELHLRWAAWYAREGQRRAAHQHVVAAVRERPLLGVSWRWWGVCAVALWPQLFSVPWVAAFYGHPLPR